MWFFQLLLYFSKFIAKNLVNTLIWVKERVRLAPAVSINTVSYYNCTFEISVRMTEKLEKFVYFGLYDVADQPGAGCTKPV